ncbi:hypothetical protein SAY87_014373 [Trapa incisa]|uniref:Uncharacterized protein n=1 Tax=Trapa incisa TaxID=236973 RepID=A0AAN7JKG0_9MYRT|nr:hypothetical protein SAY87_014373 [Trapa incisa]
MERFNNSPDARAFFGSIKACSEGISSKSLKLAWWMLAECEDNYLESPVLRENVKLYTKGKYPLLKLHVPAPQFP